MTSQFILYFAILRIYCHKQMKVLLGVDYRILEKGFEIWTAEGTPSPQKCFKLRSSNILRPNQRSIMFHL